MENKIKPFEVVQGNRVSPFTVGDEFKRREGGVKNFKEEDALQSNCVKGESFLGQKFRPFNYVSKEIAEIAENICQPLKNTLGDEEVTSLIPFIGRSLEEYRRAGGKIPCLVSSAAQMEMCGNLNFNVFLKRIVTEVYDTEFGEKYRHSYEVMVKVYLESGKVRDFTALVEGSKIKSVEWLKKCTLSLARLPRDKADKDEYEQKIQRCIETEDVPREVIYSNAGWRKVAGNWRYVYNGGIIGEQNILIHTVSGRYTMDLREEMIGQAYTFEMATGMMEICRNSVASTELFLFTHGTVLNTLFELTGYPLNFVFGVTGVTNSKKTSLALAAAKIFDRNKLEADAEFATATRCGIEKTLGIYKDAVVLVDDFKPGTDQVQQREMDRKLDELVRFYGNRVPKKRMTDFMQEGDKKYFPIGGGCVLTMEIVTGVLSSLSRMFITEIGVDDVINERLAVYQTEKWILPTHIYDFIAWTTEKFDEVCRFIKNSYPQLRKKYLFEFPRFAEMFASLMTTAAIVANYAQNRGFWNNQKGEKFLEQVQRILVTDLRIMGERIKRRDKGNLVLQALKEMLDEEVLMPIKLNEESCSRKYGLYEDESFLYIRAKELRRVVDEYCKRYHEQNKIINDDEIIGLLERMQVIEILETEAGRQRSRKLPVQRGNTLRYLYIKKDELQKITE